jgi:hypothetical protein
MRAHWIQTLFSFQLSSYCIQDFTLILPQSLLILHLHTTALSKNHCTHTRLLPCPFHIFTPLTLHTVDVHAALLLCYLLVLLSTSLPHHHPCLHDKVTMLLQSDAIKSGTIQKKRNHVSFNACSGRSPSLLSCDFVSHQFSLFGQPCSPRTGMLHSAQCILPPAAQWHEIYSAQHCL